MTRDVPGVRVAFTIPAWRHVPEPAQTLVRDVIDRVADAHPDLFALVPEIRVDCDWQTVDAGWFRFRAETPVDVVVNVANCRTTADVAYVLLHELRHAKQHATVGWERLIEGDRNSFRFTWLSWQIEADAAAWAVDEIARLRLRRRRLLWPRLSRREQPVSMHRLHCGDRPALRLWSEVDE